MNLITDVENFARGLEAKWSGWRVRLSAAVSDLENRVDPERFKIVIDLIERAHAQAEETLRTGRMPTGQHVPWELAHGLSLLDRLGDREALPRRPDELATRVLPDGSLLGCRQWELLDYRWTEALVAWLENLDHPARFNTTPALLTMPNDVVLAIAGDWGTGPFERNAPATLVAAVIGKIAPDYSFHLGDVYYAGTQSEEKNNMQAWPHGKSGAFTLNSNHEMYSGAKAYFAELERHFPRQQNTSYFALQNDHWLVIGLDSAYASDPLNLYMDGKLNRAQIDWLRGLPKDKAVIVMSHHQPYDIDGNKSTELYTQVVAALGSVPAYWYWGHLHNSIWYQPKAGMHGRCAGHGSIPYGVASELGGKANVVWYETQKAGDRNYPERVLNGCMKVVLSGDTITEQFIGEDGSARWPRA